MIGTDFQFLIIAVMLLVEMFISKVVLRNFHNLLKNVLDGLLEFLYLLVQCRFVIDIYKKLVFLHADDKILQSMYIYIKFIYKNTYILYIIIVIFQIMLICITICYIRSIRESPADEEGYGRKKQYSGVATNEY